MGSRRAASMQEGPVPATCCARRRPTASAGGQKPQASPSAGHRPAAGAPPPRVSRARYRATCWSPPDGTAHPALGRGRAGGRRCASQRAPAAAHGRRRGAASTPSTGSSLHKVGGVEFGIALDTDARYAPAFLGAVTASRIGTDVARGYGSGSVPEHRPLGRDEGGYDRIGSLFEGWVMVLITTVGGDGSSPRRCRRAHGARARRADRGHHRRHRLRGHAALQATEGDEEASPERSAR